MMYVIMSIMFLEVLMLLSMMVIVTAADGYVYVDSSDNTGNEKGAERGWADEALLDVAFYLRMHKFNEFDQR